MKQIFDVAIIGSGIGGSILATILAKQNINVVVFEGSQHPKFAIGESMILESSEVFRQLAETYEIPEIAYFSAEHFMPFVGSTHGVKRHFSYMYHRENENENPDELLMANIPKEPYGHELHIFRQDCDSFYCSLAIKYGAQVYQKSTIQNVNIDDSGVEIELTGGDKFNAKYVVDASGFKSLLANKYDLRRYDLKTQSRSIFTHAVGVPSYHKVGKSKKATGIPYSLHEGTLHHVFNGGWLWVIPFDNHYESTNHLCSIGLMLDPRVHPENSEVSAEEEFFSFIKRFPGIYKQFKNCKSIREWTRTGRIQYSSKKVVGDRFCLLGHAAGFIDPLFSKGIYITLTSIHALAPKLIQSVKENNFETGKFANYEKTVLNFITANDNLIAGAYKSFSDFSVWRSYAVLWVAGAYLEYLKLTLLRFESHRYREKENMYSFDSELNLKLVGGGYREFSQLENKVYEVLDSINFSDAKDIGIKSQKIKSLFIEAKWIPHSIKRYIHENHLNSNQYNLSFFKNQGGILGLPEYRAHFFKDLPFLWLLKEFTLEKYRYSKNTLTKRKNFDFDTFDKFVHLGELN